MQCFSLENGVFTTRVPLNIISLYKKDTSYIPYTGRLLEHILRTTTLTSNEKLFYILADGLSLISGNSSTKQRSVVLSGETWAEKLNCSKREVFALQKSLEEKGYFIIIRDTNKRGKNKRNVIIPTVPDSVFYSLDKEVDRYNISSEARPNLSMLTPISKTTTSSALFEHTQKRSYLDKTKLYIPINYQVLSVVLASSKINTFSKVLWLDFYNKCYQKYRKSKSQTYNNYLNNYFSFICSYKELENQYTCKKSWLSKTLKSLEDFGFITRSSLYIKNDDVDDNLHDKSLWNITVTIPEEYLKLQKDLAVEEEDAKVEEGNGQESEVIRERNSDVTAEINRGVSYFPPYISDNALLLNKSSSTNIKNIDNKDAENEKFNSSISDNSKSISHLSTFLKNSKIKKDYYNNSIENDSTTTLDKSKPSTLSKVGKTFKDFYPLTKEQVEILNSKSGREFNLNFGNQLLLKFSHNTCKLFLGYNQFMSYMTTAFAREKRSAYEVNNPNFRLKVNLTNEELAQNKIEEYLSQVESSSDTSHKAQLRKKISGSFDYKLAYRLLTQGKFEYS